MIRSIISLVIAGLLLIFLSRTYNEMPAGIAIVIGLFGVLFCFIAWGSARHYTRLVRARKSKPVSASIFIRASPQRRGPDRLVAEIMVRGEVWRGILTGWSYEHVLAGQTSAGLAWLDLKKGAPLELQIDGQIITPIPIVTKVNPNSLLEKIIRKVHVLDESSERSKR